jgi:hypothetical protein
MSGPLPGGASEQHLRDETILATGSDSLDNHAGATSNPP